jgi:hypothetical protein
VVRRPVTIVITVPCEGLDHRLEFRDDGEVVMLDHSEKFVRSFVAFGAKPPECMIEIDKAREDPIWFITEHLKKSPHELLMDRKVLASLACDYVEPFLHIWEERFPGDKRPRKAIQAARKFIDRRIEMQTLKKHEDAVSEAYKEAGSFEEIPWGGEKYSAWIASFVAAAAENAAWAAHLTAYVSEKALLDEVEAVQHVAWSLKVAAGDYAEIHGLDGGAAMASENKRQIAETVRFIKRIKMTEIFISRLRGEDP